MRGGPLTGWPDPFPLTYWLASRTLTVDGNPWFIAKDVCDALDLRATDSTGYRHHLRTLEAAEITPVLNTGVKIPGSGMARALLISESGFYKLVLKSRKPEAQAFKHWVCSIVLPAIRKDGGYVMGEEKVATGEMSEDELLARALQVATKKLDRLTLERDQAKSEALKFSVRARGLEPTEEVERHPPRRGGPLLPE